MKIVVVLALFALFASSFAGTVTLTGTCKTFITNNSLSFSLANSGNDSAFDLIVNPYVTGANVVGNYSWSRLGPGSVANFSILLSNITAKGTYVDYIVVNYQQGNGFFSALFPCWLEFGVPATSQLYLSSAFSHVNASVGLVNVTLMDAGTSSVDANVSLLVPPYVHVIGPAFISLNIAPSKLVHTKFEIDTNNLHGIAFDGVVYASYSRNGINFATQPSIFKFAPVSSGLSIGSLIVYGTIALIVLFAIFILIVHLRNRRGSTQHSREEHS